MKTNKQHLLSLIAATALLVACTAVDETDTPLADSQTAEQQPINFGAYMKRSTTRGGTAGEVSNTSLQTGKHKLDGFGVFAYYTDNAPYSFTALPNFMYNQQVKYESSKWTYSPVKYWPNETGSTAQSTGVDRVSFFAYAPYIDVDASTGYATSLRDPDTGELTGITALTRPNENGNPYVRYYVNTDPSKCVDLCWATPVIDKTKSNYSTTATVDFNFQHALAALNVQIDAALDPNDNGGILGADTRIYVRSITFTGFATKGQLNLYNGAWNNLECDCDVTSAPITIHDGRWDGFEGVSESLNENPTGLSPVIIQKGEYTTSPSFSSTRAGVTNKTVNLFGGTYADPSSPTDSEISAALLTPIYVIPTNVPVRVTIVYDVETYDPKLAADYLSDGATHGSSIQNTITAFVKVGGNDLKMTSGNIYTINLHLGMNSVKVNASVDPWPTTSPGVQEANVDLPNNTTTTP